MTDTVLARRDALLERFRSGQRAALARAITWVENERPGFEDVLHGALVDGPRSRRIGVTGPPGAGKSSLVAQMAQRFREAERTVGVVAVDPTSPFSGGALLGDRIRMNDLATDPGIFIRSMATRGSLGGLATATGEVVDLMDAFGLDRLLVETVGVGQTELEIQGAADTVLVVLVPESGDGIQAMKAGLMEIADVFVVNKADRPGADRLVKELRTSLGFRAGQALRGIPAHHGVDLSRVGASAEASETPSPEEPAWDIPIVKTVAQTGEGLDTLLQTMDAHAAFLEESGELELRRRARAERRIRGVVTRDLGRRLWNAAWAQEELTRGLDAIARRETTPYGIAARLTARVLPEPESGPERASDA